MTSLAAGEVRPPLLLPFNYTLTRASMHSIGRGDSVGSLALESLDESDVCFVCFVSSRRQKKMKPIPSKTRPQPPNNLKSTPSHSLSEQPLLLAERVRRLQQELSLERAAKEELAALLRAAEASAAAEREARAAAEAARDAGVGALPHAPAPPPPSSSGRANNDSAPNDDEESDVDELELLQRQVHALKESREKLIDALDSANDEAAAATTDALSLGQALSAARAETSTWEAAAQESVARADALADLLEDASRWSGGGGGGGGGSSASAGRSGAASAAAAAVSASPPPRGGDSLLAAERAARAVAEARVTALCVELGRARRSADELAAAVGPALAAVEAKLAAVRWPC